MAKVRDVLDVLETIAPRRFAAAWDKIGLQVGDGEAKVTRAVVSLDRSLAAVEACRRSGAELLLAHHPLIFAPVQTVDTRRHDTRTILALAQSGIAFVAAHTNWDAARDGINDALAHRLDLQEVRDFGMAAEVRSLKLTAAVNAFEADALAQALAEAGARITWTSAPGPEGKVRIEAVLPEGRETAIRRALRASETAYDLTPLSATLEQPMGRVGRLPSPLSLAELVGLVDARLATRSLAWGDPAKRIRRVAVVGGAADSEWIAAQRADADVLISGEVKQHVALEASESGMCILSSGHYATEQPGVLALRDRLAESLPDVEWTAYTPPPGIAGRPLE
ncbi:MAG: Nif3-like dinuclear metal center hexameric protein [Fimbriimonas sp.]